MLNTYDGLLRQTTNGGGDDPFLRYFMLGDRIEDGMFAYTCFGVDTPAGWSVNPAAWRDESGGHQNPTGSLGDGSKRPVIPPNPGGPPGGVPRGRPRRPGTPAPG